MDIPNNIAMAVIAVMLAAVLIIALFFNAPAAKHLQANILNNGTTPAAYISGALGPDFPLTTVPGTAIVANAVTVWLLLPRSNHTILHVPVWANDPAQITEICEYLPRIYLSSAYQQNRAEQASINISSASGELQLASIGADSYARNPTAPPWVAGVRCSNNITAK